MSGITKRDAATLAADIRWCKVAGHAIAERSGSSHDYMPGFIGGLQETLRSFIATHAGINAAQQITAAFEYVPTAEEIAEHNARMAGIRTQTAEGARL